MNKDPLEDKFETIAQCCLDFKAAIGAVIADLPDDEVTRLAELALRNSQPGKDVFGRGHERTFHMPMWKEMSSIIRSELRFRLIERDATEYMKKTGETVYCEGACTLKHLAEDQE